MQYINKAMTTRASASVNYKHTRKLHHATERRFQLPSISFLPRNNFLLRRFGKDREGVSSIPQSLYKLS